MRIGLDMDGVVVDWQSAAVRMMNERGYDLDVSDWKYWNWLKDQIKPKDWEWLWNKGARRSYQIPVPFPGAVDFVLKLMRKGDVVVLTSRPQGTWKDTIDWWFRYVGVAPSGFNFFESGYDKTLVPCDFLIEDNLNNANAYAEAYPNATVILLNRPWNEHGPDENLVRAMSYKDVLEEIRE